MSFRRLISFMRGGAVKDEYSNTEINRTISSGHETIILKRGAGRGSITLSPMRTLSLEPFSYPFQNTGKIRDALRLQALPYTAGGSLEIFPVVLSKSGRGSSGIVWYVSPSELEAPSSGSGKVWPSPLPFVSELEEYGCNGVTESVDEENVCSILWQSGRPVMYRWSRNAPGIIGATNSWYDEYCRSCGLERGGTYTADLSGMDDDLTGIISRSVRICPWIAGVNISREALEGARDLERALGVLARVSLWLLAAGGIMLSAEALRWRHVENEIVKARSRNEEYYRQTFDPSHTGRISNPVTLARDRIASLTGKSDDGRELDEVLADMGEIFASKKDSRITLDTIRYNADGTDCTGTAPDMTTVLEFRRAWEDKAGHVQVDNTQFVSGIGYRFDLRIRW